MKILCIADEENKGLWDHFQREKLEGVDLILSAGDLSPDYLQFLVHSFISMGIMTSPMNLIRLSAVSA